MAKVCVVCQKEKAGRPVREDIILKSIRRAKEFAKISTGNELVVCPDDYEEAKKRRQRFEKSLLTFGGIGAVLGIILVLIAIFQGRDILSIIGSLIFVVLLVAIMAALSLYQYFPAFEERGKPAKPKAIARKVKRK